MSPRRKAEAQDQPNSDDAQRLAQLEADTRAIAAYLVERDQLRQCGFADRLVELSDQRQD